MFNYGQKLNILKDYNNLRMQRGNDNMSKHIEDAKKIIECLKKTNYFHNHSDKSSENLEKVTPETLSEYAIVVQKNYNFDNTTFVYKPEDGILTRTEFTGHIEYETEENYSKQFIKCPCKNPCYKGEYTADNFIELIQRGVFEPIEFNKLTK